MLPNRLMFILFKVVHKASWRSCHELWRDYRIGMMLAIAALIAKGNIELDAPKSAIDVSYPAFFHLST